MIDRPAFLADAQKLVAKLEKDLRARCDEVPGVGQAVAAEHQRAKEAGRTGQTLEEWRADAITQQAVAWVLSSVFVRFLEDNRLIDPPKLAGPGERLSRARDEHELFFSRRPHETDREYLLAIFDDLVKRPGTRDLFGEHNPIRAIPNWLSPDAVKDLMLPFFQRIDAGTGVLIHDFTDPALDTRFLGDLYQDLSETARKKYALLQTPVFVEEFILDRTLEPAVETFGLEKVRLIDPACGSGHFLLGAFERLLVHWRKKEPDTPRRELVQRSLDAVHGVDLNPYAIAIARFRLLVAAWQHAGTITSLKNLPEFRTHLACGDSLLHGSTKPVQGSFGFPSLDHHYQPEDAVALECLLKPGHYQAVVGNPPYITPPDPGLNAKYRERFPRVCYRQYSLAMPFMQRIFDLALDGGFTGQITTNTFTKAEFGKKIIEDVLPMLDLTHVVDTAWVNLPGHNTPTVMLLGRSRKPVLPTVRTVMGIRGEQPTPQDPARGQVWRAIMDTVDTPGSSNQFVSVEDLPRQHFSKHPWVLSGGGATALKQTIEEGSTATLATLGCEIGRTTHTGEDEVFCLTATEAGRKRLNGLIVPLVTGEDVRDYSVILSQCAFFPYDKGSGRPLVPLPVEGLRHCWSFRTNLRGRRDFGQTVEQRGLQWFEHSMFFPNRFLGKEGIAYAFVQTHNHYAFESRGQRLFNRTGPLIRLAILEGERGCLAIAGLLNSSTACFWLKQVCFPKGGDNVGTDGARVRKNLWDVHYNYNGTPLATFPVPADRPLALARHLDALARQLAEQSPNRVLEQWHHQRTNVAPLASALEDALAASRRLRGAMIRLQEDLDWQCYRLYDLTRDDLVDPHGLTRDLSVQLGERAFEIVLARKIRDEELATTWFTRHGSKPITELPAHWSADYRELVQRRIAAIESNPNIALIEQPEYKRRWNDTPWEEKVTDALHAWLLDRLESYFDLDGRMNDTGKPTAQVEVSLLSIAKLADLAGRDSAFQTVAEMYRGRADFDVPKLATELVEGESVPLLPVLRYKPEGLDKRRAWERTWELQRQEDAIDARATKETLSVNDGDWTPGTDDGTSPLNKAQADLLKKEKIGPIPPPPKYKSSDFQKSDYWRLRGSLDVPKEHWVSFPHCEGADGLPLIAWAGYDHLQLAKAIADHYVQVKEQEGGRDDPRLTPLLAGLIELLPWLKQWHNEIDPEFGVAMGDFYQGFAQAEVRQLGRTMEEVRSWQPPVKKSGRGRAKSG